MIKKTIAAVTLGLTLASSWAQDINFGIISTESSQNLKSDWQPLLDDMAKQTGLKVKAFFASDYAGIIEGMRFNKVQVACSATSRRWKPLTVPTARCSPRWSTPTAPKATTRT